MALDPSLEYLLFFGLIRPYKGLDLLIKSLPQLRHTKPNARLLVVGEPYEPMRKYRELAASLSVDDLVFFHDRFVPTAQIPLWFGACDWVHKQALFFLQYHQIGCLHWSLCKV